MTNADTPEHQWISQGSVAKQVGAGKDAWDRDVWEN